ncbi:GntR family transcriptional regulator [Paracholeplasma manati]|uniref:GntR family transcriptional regulator n=1 Tax=Paracholeplasma manati TaxID=591373 RepID=A0ABT2Y8N3_9MOLU|nr:GntR family transcriptional regulator [Paracholeplasma manati]MCV2232888.1 GntR family transcriptional regulator [Paracholeplasma manati]MDG0887840.1 GntR family transcriptional regulator [Paracholeplasma manati]
MKDIQISMGSQIPIYQQLYDLISAQIIHGDLKPDEALPSIRVIAKDLRISIITVKKTWEMLESNGYIYTVVGKGSYVKNNSTSMLNRKRIEAVKDILYHALDMCKSYEVDEADLILMVKDYYSKR